MSIFRSLSYKNLKGRPGRTFILIMLSALLCLSVTGGSLVISGLKGGLLSLESKLGADIMVVPYNAITKKNFSHMLLQGNPGYFYMDRKVIDKIKSVDGVGKISEQYFFASANAGCCTAKLQLIGFNPETDFTVKPWVRESYDGELEHLEVLAGSDLNIDTGDNITFYNNVCKVRAKLKRTGTYLDTAVYMNIDTIKTLMKSANDSGMAGFDGRSPDELTSCVLVNVKEGYSPLDVMANINLKSRKTRAVRTKDVISDVADQLSSASEMIGFLIIAIWILSMIILMLAFTMIANERKKEFAILRVLGASRKLISHTILKEAFFINLVGSVIGVFVAVFSVFVFGSVSLTGFELPFLLPKTPEMILLIIVTVVISIFAGCSASSLSALKTSKIDTALILREGN